MIDVKYLKESWYSTKQEFEDAIATYLNGGYEIVGFNTYGSGGNTLNGYSVVMLTKDKETKVSI